MKSRQCVALALALALASSAATAAALGSAKQLLAAAGPSVAESSPYGDSADGGAAEVSQPLILAALAFALVLVAGPRCAPLVGALRDPRRARAPPSR